MKIMNMFEAAGYTYDQAYLTLEAINDSLLFSSRFVSVRNRPEELKKTLNIRGVKKMNQKQQQGIAAQEWTVVIVDGYNIQQSIVDEKDRDSKSQLNWN
ncbi:hypothetical protein P7H19_17255 [Paenibacillus larvae]|nr:hypothetical protein [Paenibacillus larvae]MDT2237670.1 hypothetical protein [Paenibacillus larvae]